MYSRKRLITNCAFQRNSSFICRWGSIIWNPEVLIIIIVTGFIEIAYAQLVYSSAIFVAAHIISGVHACVYEPRACVPVCNCLAFSFPVESPQMNEPIKPSCAR